MKKRILSLLLVLAMLCGLMPVFALLAGAEPAGADESPKTAVLEYAQTVSASEETKQIVELLPWVYLTTVASLDLTDTSNGAGPFEAAAAADLAAYIALADSYTEAQYDDLYVKTGLAFQADFFDTNPYWNQTIEISNVDNVANNDLTRFISYSKDPAKGYLYVENRLVGTPATMTTNTVSAHDGYLDLSLITYSSAYGLMLPSGFTSVMGNGYSGLSYSYVAAPNRTARNTLIGFAGMRVSYDMTSGKIFLWRVSEANSNVTAFSGADATAAGILLQNNKVTDFTATIRRYKASEKGVMGISTGISGNVSWGSGDVSKAFSSVISASAVPTSRGSLFVPGHVAMYQNGSSVYDTNEYPFYYSITASAQNTVDENGDAFDTFNAETQYYVKGTWSSATDDPSAYRTYFTKDAEGDGYTIAYRPTATNPPKNAGAAYYCFMQSETSETYYPVTISSFDDTSYGFITLYTKEGDDYIEVKQPTYNVTNHADVGDSGWYNNFASTADTQLYAMRVYEGEITTDVIEQNHFADVAKFYRLNVLDYIALSETDRAAVHTAMMSVGLDDATRETAQAALGAAIKAVYAAKKSAGNNTPFDHLVDVSYEYAIPATLLDEVLTSKRDVSAVCDAVTFAALANKTADEAEALFADAFDKAYYYDCYKLPDAAAQNAFIDKAAEFGVLLDELYAIPGVDALAGTATMYESFMAEAEKAEVTKEALQAIVDAYANLVLAELGGSLKTENGADYYNDLYVKEGIILALDFFQLNDYWGWTIPEGATWGDTEGSILRDEHIQWSKGSARANMSSLHEGTITLEKGYITFDPKKTGDRIVFQGTTFASFNADESYGTSSMTADFLMKLDAAGGNHRFQVADMRLAWDDSKIYGLGFNWGALVPTLETTKVNVYFDGSSTATPVINGSLDSSRGVDVSPLKSTPTLFTWAMTITNPDSSDPAYQQGGFSFNYMSVDNRYVDSTGTVKKNELGQRVDLSYNVLKDSDPDVANNYYQATGMPAGKHDESVNADFYYNGEHVLNVNGTNKDTAPGANPWSPTATSEIGYQGGMKADFYAFRFYSRILSTEEVAQNYFADLAKFYRLDLVGFDILSSDEKAQLYANMRAFTLESDRETVQQGYLDTVYAIHYEALEALSVSENYRTFLALCAENGVDPAMLTVFSESAREAAIGQILSSLRDPAAYPQHAAVIENLLENALGGSYTAPTFTHDDYNKIYVHQDRLTSWLDFFQATPADTETLLEGGAKNNVGLTIKNSHGIVKAGQMNTRNETDLQENPVRSFGDGFFRFGAPTSNISIANVYTVNGETYSETSYLQADYTIEIVMANMTGGGNWYQVDFLRPSSSVKADGSIKFDSTLTSTLHQMKNGNWTTTVKSADDAIKEMKDTENATVIRNDHSFSNSTAHTYVTRLDKSFDYETYFWKVEGTGSESVATLISKDDALALYNRMKDVDENIYNFADVVAGKDVDPTNAVVNAHQGTGVNIGPVTLDGVVTKLHVYIYEGRADYKVGVDTSTVFEGTNQLYTRQSAPYGFGTGITGDMYSYRRYDIVLTDEELAQNHFADLAKYYSLDITLYLTMTDAQKAEVHSAMASMMLAADAEEVIAAYKSAVFMALYEDVIGQMQENEADFANLIEGDTDGSIFVNRYLWFLQVFAFPLIDLSDFVALAPADTLALLDAVAYVADNQIQIYLAAGAADKAYADAVNASADVKDQMSANEIVSFLGYQVRLGDEASLKAGIRGVFHYDEAAIAALEAQGLTVEIAASVAGDETVTVPVYKTGDGFLAPIYEDKKEFVVTVLYGEEEQTKAFFDAALTFSAEVKVSGERAADSSAFSATVTVDGTTATFGDTINVSDLYRAFYETAEEVDALTEKVMEIANETTYKQITVDGLDLSDFTIRYTESYTQEQAQAVADAIYAVTGYRLSVSPMGCSSWPRASSNFIFLATPDGTGLAGNTHTEIVANAQPGMIGTLYSATQNTLYLFATDSADRADVGTWFAAHLAGLNAVDGVVTLPTEIVQN